MSLRVFSALLGARLRSALNTVWRGAGWWRLLWLLVLAVSALLWWGTFVGTRWGLTKVMELTPAGQGVALTLFEVLLVMLLATLAFSSLLFALTHIFLADDLRLLAVAPMSTTTLLAAKTVEVGVSATLMPLIFGSPVLAGFGAALNAPPLYYLLAAIALCIFVIIPTSVGLGSATVLVNVFPAGRARDILVFLAMITLLGVALTIRAMQPERFADLAALQDLSQTLAQTRLPASWILPSGWITDALRPMLTGGSAPAWSGLGYLLGAALVSTGFAGLAFHHLFRRGLSRALTSRARILSGESWAARAVASLTRLLPRHVGAIAAKDLLTLGRDTSQWSQTLLLASLVLLYLLNLHALPIGDLRAIGLTLAEGADILAFVNLSLAGFVSAAVASRFMFAAVSLEGRAVWLPRVAPLRVRAWLAAKLAVGLPLLWLYALPLIVGGWWLLGASPAVAGVTLAGMTLMSVGIACLGVGVGASTPRFHVDNPGRLVVSLPGLSFMLLAMAYIGSISAMLAYPTYVAHLSATHGAVTNDQWLLAGVLGLAALLLTAITAVAPLMLGAVRLTHYEQGS